METPGRQIQYWGAWGAIFQSPNWGMNLLLTSVCQLIPAVGPIVVLGWLAEVVESLHARPHETYPDFKFERFVPYLSRGVWPFLVMLGWMVVALPVIYLAIASPFLLLVIDDNPAMVAAAVTLAVIVFLVGLIVSGLALWPLLLRAALIQEFGAAFSWVFVKDFIARARLQLVLAILFLNLTAILALIVGYAACCIGLYPAMALMSFATWHLHYQLYELYLERGGTVIPVKAAS